MNLDQCLKACTWSRLWTIAYGRGLTVPRNPTKADLLALIRADLPHAFAQDLQHLPTDALAALHLLAHHHGWLPARAFSQRFGELRPFKPWRGDPPAETPPWRAPISLTERLWYRGLIYAQQRSYGRLGLETDGLGLPDELAARLPPLPSPAQPAPEPSDPPQPPHLLYNLTLFHAHLAATAPRPRQRRWLTPRQFRPLLDLLWPPACPIIAADRQARGEKSTRLLRAFHFLAEAAEFLPAPPPPPRRFRSPPPPPEDEIESMAPIQPVESLTLTDDPDRAYDLGRIIIVGEELPPPRPPSDEAFDLGHLLPTPLWHAWLDLPPPQQIGDLRPILAGRAPNQAHPWRVYQLPGYTDKEPLAPLRRLRRTLPYCPAGGAWLDLEAFLDSLPRYHLDLRPGETAQPDDAHRQLLTGFLAWIGIVQLDRWEQPTSFRLTPGGAILFDAQGASALSLEPPTAPLRLLPAGENGHTPHSAALAIAVEPDCRPSLLHQLRACPQVQWTAPGRLRLSPDSLANTPARQVADLVRLLDAGLPQPLPGETIHILRQWAGQGAQLTLRRITVLETDDADLLAYLSGQRGIRRHLRRAYGRRAVEVDSNSLESLLRKLCRQGFAPDVEVELDPKDRPKASRRWGAEDAGHLLLAARLYNRLPGRAPLGQARYFFRPTHYVPDSTLDRLRKGLSPRLLETVEQMVEDALKRLYDAIDGWRSPPLIGDERLNGQALDEVLDLVRDALAESRPLEIEYYTAGRGDLTRRVVEPLRLEDRDGVAYLVAYCRLRQDQRVFRADRIRAARTASALRGPHPRCADRIRAARTASAPRG